MSMKAAGEVLGDQHRTMIVLRVALPLDVSVLDRADEVRLVRRAELKLDFVAAPGVRPV